MLKKRSLNEMFKYFKEILQKYIDQDDYVNPKRVIEWLISLEIAYEQELREIVNEYISLDEYEFSRKIYKMIIEEWRKKCNVTGVEKQ